jgi:hypothetical protein
MNNNNVIKKTEKHVALKRVCDKGVVLGLAITSVSLAIELLSAIRKDFKHRHEIRKKNGK